MPAFLRGRETAITRPPTCSDSAEDLWDRQTFLYAVSKTATGVLDLLETLPDTVLKTRQTLKLEVAARPPGDSPEAGNLNGRLYAVNLVHVVDSSGRGVHAADFRWSGSGFTATGRLSGVTVPFRMEGRFCGTVVRAADPQFLGCNLIGMYRLDSSPTGDQATVRGTLDGTITCDGTRQCVDFRRFATTPGPNPRTESGMQFTVFDHTGTPSASSEVRAWGAVTGLNLGFSTRIQLPTPASSVEVTLAHFAQPARVEAHDALGTVVGSAAMSGPQNFAETLTLSASQISYITITAPQNETLLLQLCRGTARL